MANKEKFDKFAEEMAMRFEDFTKWAMENWPNKDFPLLPSDFNESRKEIRIILGDRLSQAQSASEPSDTGDNRQYVDMNPAPWP